MRSTMAFGFQLLSKLVHCVPNERDEMSAPIDTSKSAFEGGSVSFRSDLAYVHAWRRSASPAKKLESEMTGMSRYPDRSFRRIWGLIADLAGLQGMRHGTSIARRPHQPASTIRAHAVQLSDIPVRSVKFFWG